MGKLFEKFERLYVEVSIDPHSVFWDLIEECDMDDPLIILMKAEEGDEEAVELTKGFCFHDHSPRLFIVGSSRRKRPPGSLRVPDESRRRKDGRKYTGGWW